MHDKTPLPQPPPNADDSPLAHDTFEIGNQRYMSLSSFQGDAYIIRLRRTTRARNDDWLIDHDWRTVRYPTYAEARAAALSLQSWRVGGNDGRWLTSDRNPTRMPRGQMLHRYIVERYGGEALHTVTTSMPQSWSVLLNEAAAARGTTRSDLMRTIVHRWLVEQQLLPPIGRDDDTTR